MGELTNLPNIGKELEKQLNMVHINSYEGLKKRGSRNAWQAIQKIDSSACLNRLYGLEGAIRKIRWHDLPIEAKSELKEFYMQHKL